MAKHLITSALPYINGIKHLGNLVGSLLPADVSARFFRQVGHEVLFICATDEHGTPAELAALEKGQDVETFCNEQYEVQKDIYERFGLSTLAALQDLRTKNSPNICAKFSAKTATLRNAR